jgi:hypothetical protein
MSRKRPAAVLVIAIFHFLFAVCGLCGIGGQVFARQLATFGAEGPDADLQIRMMDAMEATPGYQTVQICQTVLMVVEVLLLFIAGIGLLLMQPWARTLSIIYAVLTILMVVFNLVYYFAVLQPALVPVYQELERTDPAKAKFAQLGGTGGVLFGVCFQLIYSAAVLIVMLLPSVTKAFYAAPTPEDEHEEDRYDEEDYRDR